MLIGFSFEAGSQAFRPVVFHSMSGTFNIWEIFFYYFIIIICFCLGISWIFWLEDNRILRLNSSKLPHFFFFTYRVEYLIGFPFPLNEIEVTISFSFLLGQGEREIQGKTQYTCWSRQRILPFVTEYRPSVPNLKNILMSKWHLIENQPLLREIYKDLQLLSYRKGRSLENVLVRGRFSYLGQG